MNVPADEAVDFPVVQRLRSDGHDVLCVAEMDRVFPMTKYCKLLTTKMPLLLTADKDFGELVHRLRRISAEVLLIRLVRVSSASFKR